MNYLPITGLVSWSGREKVIVAKQQTMNNLAAIILIYFLWLKVFCNTNDIQWTHWNRETVELSQWAVELSFILLGDPHPPTSSKAANVFSRNPVLQYFTASIKNSFISLMGILWFDNRYQLKRKNDINEFSLIFD